MLRRRFWLLSVLCLSLPGVLVAQEAPPNPVSLKKVVLFNSGVGYFEHGGTVAGDATVELKFKVDDVNDLLKSMVLRDLDGGKISTVTYGSRDPITRALQTFAIDLTNEPTLADLLKQVRGEGVQVQLVGEKVVQGKILGVERRKKPVGEKDVVEVDYLNLVTEQGLASYAMEQVLSIQLQNEQLNQDLQQALLVLAAGKSNDKKAVTLNFTGEGDRRVSVGYIQETPIWKTSYRLVLSDDEAPFLQGWAIVENTTEEDWQDVSLALMSGRPISFRMDLYQPLYVVRPLVVPELFASLVPRTYDQDLVAADEEFADKAQDGAPEEKRAVANNRARFGTMGGGMGGMGGGMGGSFGGARPGAAAERETLGETALSIAQAGDVGELFEYKISTPVTLQRQKSAMLPIVNSGVEGKKVSIYDPAVQVKHPLNGLQLKNSTDLHLMQGPITVYDDGAYAGDARIEDLPPQSQRLISYAIDLDTEVSPQAKQHPEQMLSVKLVRGVLYHERKLQRETIYTVKNSGKRDKTVLIEYPVDASWKLLEPQEPAEKTRDKYRFEVVAQPGKAAELRVLEEQTVTQGIGIAGLDDNTILHYANSSVISAKAKAALEKILAMKRKLAELVAQREKLQGAIAVIEQEQARIRQNMENLDRASELYRKYVKKFTEQEDQNDKLREQVAAAMDAEAGQRQAFDDFIASLDL